MIYGFMHICTINHWREIVNEQVRTMKRSGILDRTKAIYCGVVGTEKFNPPNPKFRVIYESPNIYEYEFATLKPLHTFCQEFCSAKVFYIHSKGITNRGGEIDPPPNDKRKYCVGQWRRFMEDIIITRYNTCLNVLKKADICGVNWRRLHTPPYLAGNFWWANAKYIATLPHITDEQAQQRAYAEFWIGQGEGIAASMWTSRKNHYTGNYRKGMYMGWQQPIEFYRFSKGTSEADPYMIEWRGNNYAIL